MHKRTLNSTFDLSGLPFFLKEQERMDGTRLVLERANTVFVVFKFGRLEGSLPSFSGHVCVHGGGRGMGMTSRAVGMSCGSSGQCRSV